MPKVNGKIWQKMAVDSFYRANFVILIISMSVYIYALNPFFHLCIYLFMHLFIFEVLNLFGNSVLECYTEYYTETHKCLNNSIVLSECMLNWHRGIVKQILKYLNLKVILKAIKNP